MGKSPYELLDRWISHVEIGRALDLGAGDGAVAIWLSNFGFDVTAVEADRAVFQTLHAATERTEIQSVYTDLQDFKFDTEAYSIITAFGVLHFLRPTHVWTIADHIVRSLAPGGLFICEAFTTDDPEFDQLRLRGFEMIEPNTFHIPSSQRPIHYFEVGELTRVFSELEVLEFEEYRRIDPESEQGFRAGAALVAKKRA
jgi:SAM-dependent methyltransferase